MTSSYQGHRGRCTSGASSRTRGSAARSSECWAEAASSTCWSSSRRQWWGGLCVCESDILDLGAMWKAFSWTWDWFDFDLGVPPSCPPTWFCQIPVSPGRIGIQWNTQNSSQHNLVHEQMDTLHTIWKGFCRNTVPKFLHLRTLGVRRVQQRRGLCRPPPWQVPPDKSSPD